MNNQYGRLEYWEERYQKDSDYFDWYQRWRDLKPILKDYFDEHSKVLIVGCGTSRLSEELNEENYQSVTNIDFSSNVIAKMADKYAKNAPAIQYIHADVRQTAFEEKEYDVVIDKACLDSILCGEDSTKNTKKALEEIYRVLKNDGVYILVTYGAPDSRRSYLENENLNWEIYEHTLAKPTVANAPTVGDKNSSVHYIYVCKKRNLRNDFNDEEADNNVQN